MNMSTQQFVEAVPSIHPETRIGYVELIVADLDRQLAFYQATLGFKLHRREGSTAYLGAGGADLLRLTQRPHVQRVRGTTGLYHLAVLMPSRVELAQIARRLSETRTPVQGLVDHHISEAIYLADPEGNGIELCRDYPREKWVDFETMMRLGNAPLDVQGLFGELETAPETWTGLHPDTTIGHVHLHVADIKAARAFYHDIIGFDVIGVFPGQADFVSAGGYHHHLGYNVWAGVGAPPPPANATGLRYFVVEVPTQAEYDRILARVKAAGLPSEAHENGVLLRDPSQNALLLVSNAG